MNSRHEWWDEWTEMWYEIGWKVYFEYVGRPRNSQDDWQERVWGRIAKRYNKWHRRAWRRIRRWLFY